MCLRVQEYVLRDKAPVRTRAWLGNIRIMSLASSILFVFWTTLYIVALVKHGEAHLMNPVTMFS